MGIVFLSPSVAALSSQGNFFFLLPLGLRFPQVLHPLSLLFSSICMGISFYSPSVAALSCQDFFSAHRSAISTGTALCFCYPYQNFFFFWHYIKFAIIDICIAVRFCETEFRNNEHDQPANLKRINNIYIYIYIFFF